MTRVYWKQILGRPRVVDEGIGLGRSRESWAAFMYHSTARARANGVGLCFIHGASLGSGKQTRFIRLESAAVLARPEATAEEGGEVRSVR